MKVSTERNVKKLFALSLNQCAFPSCVSPIVGASDEMLGEICHITARSPDGPRYDRNQTEQKRHAFENLILLCRNHHKTVDDDPERYTVEWLRRTKCQHEQNGSIELDQRDARLARLLLESYLQLFKTVSPETSINQIASGKNITQVAGNYHHHGSTAKQTVLVSPPSGAVSPSELRQIGAWIESLVEKTTAMPRGRAFGMWWNRFKSRFGVAKAEQLLSAQMPEVASWHQQQAAILKQGLRVNAPDVWRRERYAAIHAAINQMRVDKPSYYSNVSSRLKMKNPFTSLTELTKVNLERVYTMVLRDARDG